MKLHSSTSPRRRFNSIAAVVLVIAAALVFEAAAPSPVHAAPNQLEVNVVSARTEGAVVEGQPITEFKYIINVDNTGTTEQRAPERRLLTRGPRTTPTRATGRRWASPVQRPIFTQGDQSDFAGAGLTIPDGRYLISVLADGYKLDGEHFTMPLVATRSRSHMQHRTAAPDATIQAAVFEDISPVNGAPDLPAEHGLAGFTGVVRDTLGEVTTDVYGAPLCGNGVCLSYCYVVDGGVDIGIVLPDSTDRCPNDPTGLVDDPTGRTT